jgi:hypothetical protein
VSRGGCALGFIDDGCATYTHAVRASALPSQIGMAGWPWMDGCAAAPSRSRTPTESFMVVMDQ